MTLREFAKGYDGNIMLKVFENEKSTTPTAIMMTQITDSIKDEVLDKEVYSYTMVCASLFERYLRVNFEAVPEIPNETEETTREPIFLTQSLLVCVRTQLLSA